jgi:hypothetical protein
MRETHPRLEKVVRVAVGPPPHLSFGVGGSMQNHARVFPSSRLLLHCSTVIPLTFISVVKAAAFLHLDQRPLRSRNAINHNAKDHIQEEYELRRYLR